MDPSAVAVLMEDSAAVAGVFLATTSILLTHFTGSVVYDAVGSITIGGKYECTYVCVSMWWYVEVCTRA